MRLFPYIFVVCSVYAKYLHKTNTNDTDVIDIPRKFLKNSTTYH
jgi:hypothetical protein